MQTPPRAVSPTWQVVETAESRRPCHGARPAPFQHSLIFIIVIVGFRPTTQVTPLTANLPRPNVTSDVVTVNVTLALTSRPQVDGGTVWANLQPLCRRRCGSQ